MRGLWCATPLLCVGAAAQAHQGNAPALQFIHPGVGQIVDVSESAEIRWIDAAPTANATLTLYHSAEPWVASTLRLFAAGLEEDCDPADGGPVFTGLWDGGEPDAALCGLSTDPCTVANDCYRWAVRDLAAGNHFVVGALVAQHNDEISDTVTSVSPGLIRVTSVGMNVHPALVLLGPGSSGEMADGCWRLNWVDSDPDDDAVVRLFLRPAGTNEDLPVASNISEDDMQNAYDVDLTQLDYLVEYEVHAAISDGTHDPFLVRAPGLLARTPGAGPQGCAPTMTDGSVVVPDAAFAQDAAPYPDASLLADAHGNLPLDAANGDSSNAPNDASVMGSVADGGSTVDGREPMPDSRLGACSDAHGWSQWTALGPVLVVLGVRHARRKR
jgi:hypothetical protein